MNATFWHSEVQLTPRHHAEKWPDAATMFHPSASRWYRLRSLEMVRWSFETEGSRAMEVPKLSNIRPFYYWPPWVWGCRMGFDYHMRNSRAGAGAGKSLGVKPSSSKYQGKVIWVSYIWSLSSSSSSSDICIHIYIYTYIYLSIYLFPPFSLSLSLSPSLRDVYI